MSTKKIITKSAEETRAAAARFARQIARRIPGNTALILALHGTLGAGKTTFAQGFAEGLGVKEVVNSPTFVIMKKFKIPTNGKFQIPNSKSQTNPNSKIQNAKSHSSSKIQNTVFRHLYHIDCYRLEHPEELLQLGFKEIMRNPQNIVAIEWPERVESFLPRRRISIFCKHVSQNERELTLIGPLRVGKTKPHQE